MRLAQLKKHTFFLILSILINLSKILWNPPEIIMLYLNPSFSIRTLKTFRLLDRVNKNRRKIYWYKDVLWVYKGSRKKDIFLMARTLRGVGGRAGYKEEINFPRKNNKISKIFKTRKKSARKKKKNLVTNRNHFKLSIYSFLRQKYFFSEFSSDHWPLKIKKKSIKKKSLVH